MKQPNKIIPLTYLGPIQLFAHLKEGDHVLIDQHCSYERKSFRNRCNIIGANGPLSLSVPVINQKNIKIKTADALISYDTDWQKQHWRSIISAYNSSPFLEYYADDFEHFYEKRFNSLVQFNVGLFQTILDALELNITYSLSSEYIECDENQEDLRFLISPKHKPEYDQSFKVIDYWQVFAQKHGFLPHMSILDLLFNMGPESNIVLAQSLNI
nr:WbqC family protein [uncultured Carboxylicivirga sp.]